MDGDKESHTSIWSRLGHLFGREEEESLERAIIDARADGEVEAEEESMLLGILRFNDLQVQDAMIPRTDIDSVQQDLSIKETATIAVNSGHSRIPVSKGTLDNIVGIVHVKDLLPSLINPEKQNDPVSTVMRDPFFVPETKKIGTLLQEFRTRKQHIAIALDEYGGTSGLITIEDLIEEIVGEIEDEHDKPAEEDILSLGDGSYELSGRAYLEDLVDLGISIESEEVDTIGGYLSMEAGHVPTSNESFDIKGWHFLVVDADKKHIKRLRISPQEERKEA